MSHMVKCVKLGHEAEGLDEPPFDTELGNRIYENVSKEAWTLWSNHMRMLLNEYRLQPWRAEHQAFIAEQMQQFFFGDGGTVPEQFTPEEK
jgi:Fe-S cluster biosynthesis and repair protein YggX